MTKEEIYDSQLFPLVGQIIEICKAHKIPMLASFGLEEDGEEDGLHCSSALLEEEFNPSPGLLAASREIFRPSPSFVAITISRKPE